MYAGILQLARDRRGASTIELAFALPVFVVLLIGIFEFGRLFLTWSTIQYAAEQTGRFAMSRPNATAPELTAFLKEHIHGVARSSVVISVTPETEAGVPYMVIVARVNFSFIGLFPIGPIDLEGRSRVPTVA
ncbi:MAG TPA: TadE/TadG family type IV pilus assembly protein [Alphaproteobacteria bacterium]|nr:TadE/TadG family type IV pilus assembly protein [Alphaproteobacteria bacterium]